MAVKRAKITRRSNSASAKAKTAKRSLGTAQDKPKQAATPAPKTKKPRKVSRPAPAPQANGSGSNVVKVVEAALEDMKAVNIKVLDVRKLTDIADTLIIASGNSDRHVRSIADRVIEFAKRAGLRPMGVEGERDGEWVLIDMQDVIVHVMLPRIREFYRLENLWDVSAARREAAVSERVKAVGDAG